MVNVKRTTILPILLGFLLAAVPGTVGARGVSPPEAGSAPSGDLAPGAGVEGPGDLTGRWYSDFGYMELRQNGQEVEGTYSCCEGTLEGTLKGPQLEFEWQDPIYGEGWGVLLWKPEEPDRLAGGWGRSDDMGYAGRWFAARVPDWSFEGQPTTWLVESEHETFGPLRATARLYRSGDEVEGYLEGVYPTEARGKPFRMEVLYRLSGRWEGDRLVLSWQDVAREDDEGTMELEPLDESRDDGGSGVLEGRWEGHLSASPEPVRLIPAADGGA